MNFFYNLAIVLFSKVLPFMALFNHKLKLFVEGRKQVFQTLEHNISKDHDWVWFHAASLGEFEQGIPVMERFKSEYPKDKILVTFFSPSGFEVRKNNKIADLTIYLPLDTKNNVQRFLQIVNPKKVFFIKYEFWPNYLNELSARKIPTYLISGIFRKEQVFFKSYGGFYRKALQKINYFFVQNQISKDLLNQIGFQNVIISGDTRFDRVGAILKQNNTLDFIKEFKNNKLLIVVGSSWPKDEALFIQLINQLPINVNVVFAPHLIHKENIDALKTKFSKPVVLFSEIEGKNLADYQVMIIDAIGFLTKVYSEADIAYVGGGFGTAGLHNILEPATFGIPVMIGPNYEKFNEAKELVKLGGCLVVDGQEMFNQMVMKLINDANFRFEKGKICADFVQNNQGATDSIFNYLKNEK